MVWKIQGGAHGETWWNWTYQLRVQNLHMQDLKKNMLNVTLPETNIFAPENWMVGILAFYGGPAYFQGLCHVSFREGKCYIHDPKKN